MKRWKKNNCASPHIPIHTRPHLRRISGGGWGSGFPPLPLWIRLCYNTSLGNFDTRYRTDVSILEQFSRWHVLSFLKEIVSSSMVSKVAVQKTFKISPPIFFQNFASYLAFKNLSKICQRLAFKISPAICFLNFWTLRDGEILKARCFDNEFSFSSFWKQLS